MIMLKQCICYLIIFCWFTGFSQSEITSETTYYFIRHAEKKRGDNVGKNPHLSKKGIVRAKSWRDYFRDVPFDAIYSTDYNRTIETARPTAKTNQLEIKSYDPQQLYSDKFRKETEGKTVLVVGHSNTTAAFVNAILKKDYYEEIDDNNNSNLYIVKIIDDTIDHRLLVVE